jgi:hypothetical protein
MALREPAEGLEASVWLLVSFFNFCFKLETALGIVSFAVDDQAASLFPWPPNAAREPEMNLQDFAAKLQQQTRQSRFFGAARKGENYELRADLNSEYRDRRKDAIKRVIANMTVGKVKQKSALTESATLISKPQDVSGLFPDVLKNMQSVFLPL